MLKEAEIINFQGHQHTVFDFHPNVNAIIGPSDSGKSGAIRSLKWNFLDTPKGDSFKSDFSGVRDPVIVSTVFEDGTIVREKQKGTNQYTVIADEEITLKDLRRGVPEEVQSITRISATNIQDQQDLYFLLNETPGAVAKKLNSIAGLEIMDKAISEVNSLSRETNSKIRRKEAEITDLKKNITDLSWTKSAVLHIEEINQKSNELYHRIEYFNKVDTLLISIEEIQEGIVKFKNIDLSLEDIKRVIDKLTELTTVKSEYNALVKLTNSLIQGNSELTLYTPIGKAETALKSISNAAVQITIKNKEYKDISWLVWSVLETKTEIKKALKDIDSLEQEYLELNKSIKICPTCGQEIKGDIEGGIV